MACRFGARDSIVVAIPSTTTLMQASGLSESIEMQVSPVELFAIYADVDAWPRWDADLQAAALDGPFAVGTRGWIKPLRGPRMKTRITALIPDRAFSAESSLPGCRLTFTHEITSSPAPAAASGPAAMIRVVHGARFQGLLAPLFERLIGRQIRRSLPSTLASLKRHVESGATPSA